MCMLSKETGIPLRSYVEEMLQLSAKGDAYKFAALTNKCAGLTVRFLIDGSEPDEFLLSVSKGELHMVSDKSASGGSATLQISPEVFIGIMRGLETPTEAFMSGHLKAFGEFQELFKLHDLFSGLAELTLSSTAMREATVRFERSHSR